MYVLVMVIGYYGYGEGAPNNLAEALATDFPFVGRVTSAAILVNCLISAPFFIYVIINSFENTGESSVHTSFTVPNIGFRVGLIITLCILGYLAPNIGALISLISAVFCVCNNIFLPIGFFYMVRKKLAGYEQLEPLPGYKVLIHVMIVVFGLFTMIFGVKGALISFSHSAEGSMEGLNETMQEMLSTAATTSMAVAANTTMESAMTTTMEAMTTTIINASEAINL